MSLSVRSEIRSNGAGRGIRPVSVVPQEGRIGRIVTVLAYACALPGVNNKKGEKMSKQSREQALTLIVAWSWTILFFILVIAFFIGLISK